MKRKIFLKNVLILLAVVLSISTFPFSILTIAAEGPNLPSTSWTANGNYSINWYSESETQYEIKTAGELAGLAYLSQTGISFLGKTIYITADIDLGAHNWTGIGTVTDAAFAGTIIGMKNGVAGNSVTICNMICANASQSYTGFIRRQSAGGIQNLIFENAYVIGNGYHAVVCGDVRLKTAIASYQNITVKNSQVKEGVAGTSVSGGIFGCVNLWGRTVTMSGLKAVDCSVVSSGAEAGAVIGRATWGTLNLEDSAAIDCSVSSATKAGGIIGWSDLSAISFDQCFASGFVKAQNTAAGGFLGYYSAVAATLSFVNCQSDGIVQVENNGYGGLFLGVAVDSNLSTVTFDKCLATGISRSGDIFAWVGYNGIHKLSATNCYSNTQLPIAGSIVATYVDFVVLDESSTKNRLSNFDFDSIWLFRNGKEPILRLANDLSNDQYATADLYWFDPTQKTKTFNITTERQLVGLGKLSYLINSVEYQFNITASLHDEMTNSLFDESFLLDYNLGKVKPILEGFQIRDNGDGTYDVRFVAMLDDYEKYIEAGFDFVLNGDSTKSVQGVCNYVYTSLHVGDDTIYATDFGGGYFFCYEIRCLQQQISYTFDVTCYTKTENETVHGTTWTIALNADGSYDVYVKGYEEIYFLDHYTQIVVPYNAGEIETLIANELKTIIAERWGHNISVVTDRWLSNQKQNEIIIGNTSRTSATDLEGHDYSISTDGGNLLLSSGSAYGLRAAADKLCQTLSQNGGMLKESLLSQTGNAVAGATQDSSAYYISNRQGDVRIMTFNIYGWEEYGGVNLRTEMQQETIAAYMPDVVCFQEYGDFNKIGYRTAMTEKMNALGYEEVEVGPISGSNCTPLFYNPLTVRLTSENSYGYLLYSGANDVNSKSLTWAVFEENKADGKRFAVISTHFMWDDGIDHTSTRVSNAQELLGIVCNIQTQYGNSLPIIVGGDLNCTQSSQPITTLKNGGLQWFYDLAAVTQEYGFAGYPTYDEDKKFYTQYKVGTLYTDSNINQNNAIDFMLGQGNMIVENYITITDYFARCSSDHSPKIADIILKDTVPPSGFGSQNDDIGTIPVLN